MARKRKGGHDKHGEKPVQRNAANARERARMRVLSKAFSRLKTTLPWVPADTKLSKLDTLRLAASYIAHLRQILTEDCSGPPNTSIHPINLTWPFTFNAARAQQEADANSIIHHQVGASSVTSALDSSFDVSSPSDMDYSHHVTQ